MRPSLSNVPLSKASTQARASQSAYSPSTCSSTCSPPCSPRPSAQRSSKVQCARQRAQRRLSQIALLKRGRVSRRASFSQNPAHESSAHLVLVDSLSRLSRLPRSTAAGRLIGHVLPLKMQIFQRRKREQTARRTRREREAGKGREEEGKGEGEGHALVSETFQRAPPHSTARASLQSALSPGRSSPFQRPNAARSRAHPVRRCVRARFPCVSRDSHRERVRERARQRTIAAACSSRTRQF